MSYRDLVQTFAPERNAHFSLVDALPYRSPIDPAPFRLRHWVTLSQVHGVDGVFQSSAKLQHAVKADWHYTYERGLGLGILVADCTAVLISGKNHESDFIAAIHAGWRGTAGGILERAIDEIHAKAGFYAWLSPSICFENYEVDQKVIEHFPSKVSKFIRPSRPGHYFLDLKAYQKDCLETLGAKVWASSLCTKEQPEFFSYRASKGQLENRHLAWTSLPL